MLQGYKLPAGVQGLAIFTRTVNMSFMVAVLLQKVLLQKVLVQLHMLCAANMIW